MKSSNNSSIIQWLIPWVLQFDMFSCTGTFESTGEDSELSQYDCNEYY